MKMYNRLTLWMTLADGPVLGDTASPDRECYRLATPAIIRPMGFNKRRMERERQPARRLEPEQRHRELGRAHHSGREARRHLEQPRSTQGAAIVLSNDRDGNPRRHAYPHLRVSGVSAVRRDRSAHARSPSADDHRRAHSEAIVPPMLSEPAVRPAIGAAAMKPGARYEITVDGKSRTMRDTKAVAIEAGEFLKSKNPNVEVAIVALVAGEKTIIKSGPMLLK
jgi:hypothetical protein